MSRVYLAVGRLATVRKVVIALFYVAVAIGFILLIWAGRTIGLWLANLYGSKIDVYQNGYLHGFEDGIKHADSMRIKQEKER